MFMLSRVARLAISPGSRGSQQFQEIYQVSTGGIKAMLKFISTGTSMYLPDSLDPVWIGTSLIKTKFTNESGKYSKPAFNTYDLLTGLLGPY